MARFAASEVAEIGIRIEQNGHAFYTALAAKTNAAAAAAVFRLLAEQEEKHIAVFTRLRQEAETYETAEAYPDEYFAYLRTLADGHVFTRAASGAAAAAQAADDRAAVDLALRFERESVAFFTEMKQLVPAAEHALLDRLIAEEEKHVAQLQQLRGSMAGGG